MRDSWFLTSRSFLLSLALHVIIGVVLFFSFDFTAKPITPPKPMVNIVKATAIDKNQVDQELKRLKEKEEKKKQDELKRKKELERKEKELKKKQAAEKKKEQARKKAEKEKLRLKKLEEEKKKKAAAEKKRKEKEAAEKKKREAERKKQEAEKKKREEEKKRKQEEAERKAREQALQEELEAEQKAVQEAKDLSEIQKYQIRIARAIENKFNRLGLEEGLSCVILIRMIAGGKVVEASIVQSSGNDLFDKRAEDAVYKSSPLPVPDETRLFEKMRNIRFTFEP